MPLWTCEQCGAQFPESAVPPQACPVCEDERQYVNWKGQAWLTREHLAQHHRLVWRDDLGLPGIAVEPGFAIGQRALLVPEGDGCVMWDCVPLATREAIDYVRSLGGLKAIAVSHPHYYGAVVDWSEAFGGVPIYLHNDDARWVCRPDPRITFWAGDTYPAGEGVTLVRCGGHFEGSTLLHWAAGADGRGVLLGSDTVKVGWDLASVSVMRSYPNLIPVGPSALGQVEAALEPLAYDRIYGAWTRHVIHANARDIVAKSFARYRAAILK